MYITYNQMTLSLLIRIRLYVRCSHIKTNI
nr:MAG TPA_asm: hypothetical protein [Caudoviricetes sp.]